MRHHTCSCEKPEYSGAMYLGQRQCKHCRRLIGAPPPPKPKRLEPPAPAPVEPIDRPTAVMLGASIFRARPESRNIDVYNRLCDELGRAAPSYSTWMNGWATEARKRSGTKPIAGRPAL